MTADLEHRPDPDHLGGRRDDRADDDTPPDGPLGTGHDIGQIVRDVVAAAVDAGRLSAGVVADGAESAARALAHRVVGGAVADPRPVDDERRLVEALAERPTTNIAGGTFATAFAIRSLKRLGPLAKLTKRSPLWLALSALPAFTASVTRGSDELALVSSLLTHRARAAGVTPDPERVRRATVQLLSREPVDPEVEPSHGALVVGWLSRGVRAALPFTKGAATSDPRGLAAATAAVDPHRLARP